MNLDLINDNNSLGKNWGFLRNVIRQLWITFAEGLRVNVKDKYYGGETDVWNQKFENNLKISSDLIDKTEILTSYSNNNYTYSQKSILNMTVGNYLMR